MRRSRLRIPLLVIGILVALYVLVLLPGRWTDLGLWFMLALAIPPLVYGLWPDRVRAFLARGWGRILKIVLLCGYGLWLVSFAVIAALITGYALDPPDPGADAVIVLGAGLWNGEPSPALRERLDAGLAYAQANPDAWVVVSGGQGPDEPRPEAHVMAEYLESRGLDPQRILREDGSFSTYDNFVLSKAILDERLGDDYRVVFVTNDFHILRAHGLALDEGLNAQGLASPSNVLFIPMYYVREYMAILKYWLLGGESLPWLARVF